MNRAFLPFAKSLFVALLAVSSVAVAAEGGKVVKADPAKGETIYTNGDASRNIPACVACHGAAGNSTIVQNPKLSDQHEPYTYKQLMDFRTPARANPIMSPISKALTEQDMHNISAWLTSRKPSQARPRTRPASTLARRSTAAASQRKTCRHAQAATAPTAPAYRRSLPDWLASTRNTPAHS